MDYINKKCFYYHKIGHILYHCEKMKVGLEELKQSRNKFGDVMIPMVDKSNNGDVLMVRKGKKVLKNSGIFRFCMLLPYLFKERIV